MPKLGVNIDHVATIREARGGIMPDPIKAAAICKQAGADSIVVHLREDRRHIHDRDLATLRKTVKTRLNLEMSINQEIVDIACSVVPNQATFVPEKRKELTTEGGLDVISNESKVRNATEALKQKNIVVSFFIDPDKKQIEASKRLNCDAIEIHTGRYADSKNEPEQKQHLQEIIEAAEFASKLGLTVNAGHGLNYKNVKEIVKINQIKELNIGHSIISQAVFVGLGEAVRQMVNLIRT